MCKAFIYFHAYFVRLTYLVIHVPKWYNKVEVQNKVDVAKWSVCQSEDLLQEKQQQQHVELVLQIVG